jgi:hypothetical protein
MPALLFQAETKNKTILTETLPAVLFLLTACHADAIKSNSKYLPSNASHLNLLSHLPEPSRLKTLA